MYASFRLVEKQTDLQETELQAGQKEEEVYESTTGAAFNVTTNANQPFTPAYESLNASNRNYYTGLRPANDWYRREKYEEWRSEKEQERESDATQRHSRRRPSPRRSPTDDRR